MDSENTSCNYVQLKQHKKEWTLGRYLSVTLQDFPDEFPFTIYTDAYFGNINGLLYFLIEMFLYQTAIWLNLIFGMTVDQSCDCGVDFQTIFRTFSCLFL